MKDWWLIEQEIDKKYPHVTDIFHFVIGFIASYNYTWLLIISIIYFAYQLYEYAHINDEIQYDIVEYLLGVFIGLLIFQS
jgi:hypothetical protein